MRIDRCVCTQRPFEGLLDQARTQGLTLRQLAETTGASACCTMCGPYLRRCYRTGQTVFTHVLYQDDEPSETDSDQRPCAPLPEGHMRP